MKRNWLLLLIAVAALCVGLVGAGAASAKPGNGAATPFKLSYGPLPEFGILFHADCSGAHIVNVNTGMIKDSETCLFSGDTSAFVAGTYSGDPAGVVPWFSDEPTLWVSDYPGYTEFVFATHWTFTLVQNGDGSWTAEMVSYYN